ncbi:acyl carrier protein [Streptomyces tricolor]|nr:acyl carrier protein [Streptomyces tricolor]
MFTRIWASIFGADAVRPDADFFDLGGDSLTAMRLLARLEEQLGEDVLEPDMIFTESTYGALAAAVQASGEPPPDRPGPDDVRRPVVPPPGRPARRPDPAGGPAVRGRRRGGLPDLDRGARPPTWNRCGYGCPAGRAGCARPRCPTGTPWSARSAAR